MKRLPMGGGAVRPWGRPVGRLHGVAGLLGLVLGLLGVGLAGMDEWVALWSLSATLTQLRAQIDSAAPTPTPESLPVASGPTAPSVAEREAAWLWLQQGLQAQGLRVQWLRPDALQSLGVLPSQQADLRVLGAWGDWLVWSQQWAAHAPWWRWLVWHVQPAGAPGQVQVDMRLQLWLQPEAAQPPQARVWPTGSVVRHAASPLFATAEEQALPPPQLAQPMASEADTAWRLWGVWTQAGQSHAVLGHGPQWTLLSPGQTWGPQHLRLDGLGPEGAHLRGVRAQSTWLPWQGEKP